MWVLFVNTIAFIIGTGISYIFLLQKDLVFFIDEC